MLVVQLKKEPRASDASMSVSEEAPYHVTVAFNAFSPSEFSVPLKCVSCAQPPTFEY